jgi:hypothetical protein
MERFKDDDPGYRRWTLLHPEGIVLTKKGSDFALHRSGCDHIFGIVEAVKLTSAEKLCSESQSELKSYAKKKTGHSPLTCEDC